MVGAKLTGAGRYRDILAMQDAGADHIFDFVDAGLPSTVVPESEYRPALRNLLSRMAGRGGRRRSWRRSAPRRSSPTTGERPSRRSGAERALHGALRLRPLRRHAA